MAKKRRDVLPSRRGGGGGGGGGGNAGRPTGGSAGGEGGQPPVGYETKFADFIRMIAEKKGGNQVLGIHHPSVIGENYAELVESLSRLAEADLSLHVAERQPGYTAATGSPTAPKSAPIGRRHALPRPDLSVPASGDEPAKFGEAGVMGILMNPIYAGVGDYPQMIPDEHRINNARLSLEEDGRTSFW